MWSTITDNYCIIKDLSTECYIADESLNVVSNGSDAMEFKHKVDAIIWIRNSNFTNPFEIVEVYRNDRAE